MLIITIRTDRPEAELGLFSEETQLAYETWQAHRQLAETLHARLKTLLSTHGKKLHDVGGIVVFQGPGSFTGLRIGITVANALAYGLDARIIASADPKWLESGIRALLDGKSDPVALPEYGAEPHITAQKK
jgi:tRNA threonylcarbamoyladenosine biosynthesis protein TsaB